MALIDYTREDFISDSAILIVLGMLTFGYFRFVKPSMARAQAERAHRQEEPVPKGTAINDSWSVQAIENGQIIPLSSLKGKVIFLNFWATWCGPCRMEMPSIETLYQRYKNTDVVFLCVSREAPTTLRPFVLKQGMDVPVYAARKIPAFFNMTALPTTFIISRSGKIALSRTGANLWNQGDTTSLLDTLLAEPITQSETKGASRNIDD
jgi:thiol-disulfide isomerase/thioredoxin